MPNVSNVKSKYFEPDGVDADQVSASAAATTLAIADGGPYGNLTETITLYSSADNRGNTFTITGTDGNGDAQTEDLTGPNSTSTVSSANKYLTVTSIVSDGAIATDIQAGILGTGDLTGIVFAGRTRIRGITGTSKAVAGSIVFKNTCPVRSPVPSIPA